MNNEVTRLRDEIMGQELAISKEQQEHKRLEKDNKALKVLAVEGSLRFIYVTISQNHKHNSGGK